MSDLLLKITTKPIEYSIHTEPASLNISPADNPEVNQVSKSAKLNIKNVDAKINIDSTPTYESLNIKDVDKVIKDSASKGVQTANSATSEYVKLGNSLSKIQNGSDVGDYFRSKHMSQVSIASQLSLMDIASPEITMEQKAETIINVSPPSLEQNWNIEKNKMEFVPGKYYMEITQFPEVKIEYVGGINYVPPSSSPYYEEPES